MEIKDLAGFSEPLKKFIEVVSNGIGALTGPSLIRKNADAKAYEMRTVALAVADSQKLIGKVEYSSNGLLLTSGDLNMEGNNAPALSIHDRTSSRLNYQQIKKQLNLERIISLAADEFNDETLISEEPLDEDWISRFFNLAEDINSEEMKILWAKILAGEVKKPKSYSLRTLEVLKNIAKDEAELFARFSQFAISCSNDTFVLIETLKEYGIKFSELLLLEELGFITGVAGNVSFKYDSAEVIFVNGDTVLILDRKDTTEKSILVYPFTNIGKQLLSLIDVLSDIEYLKKFATKILNEGEVMRYGTILKNDNGTIEATDLVDL